MNKLAYIKRLVVDGYISYTNKAINDMEVDCLEEGDVEESIMNATAFRTKRSISPRRSKKSEKIYIIESFTHTGLSLYTKGVIRKFMGQDNFYILISAKRSAKSV